MRRMLLLALVTVASLVLVTPPTVAITDGQPDGDGHPYVGLMVTTRTDGFSRCSGTLVSPTLFVTAGHCTTDALSVEIWFAPGPIETDPAFPAAGPDVCAGISGYPCQGEVSGTPYTHPDYDDGSFAQHDLGVVVLDEPVALPEYGVLPELGAFDSLDPSNSTVFTAVGYGVQKAHPKKASKDQAVRVRMVAQPRLTKFLGDYALIVSANSNTGGTCTGDSGGPNFLGTSNVIAGVTSFANNDPCGGQAGVYRLDGADDLAWLTEEFGDHL